MNLMILNDGHIYKIHDEYFADDLFFRFINEFSGYCYKIIVCCPVYGFDNPENARLSRINPDSKGIIEILKTFPYKSVMEYYLKMPLIFIYNIPVLLKAAKNSDIIFMRLPAMNSLLCLVLSRIYHKPLVSYVVGYEKSVVEKGNKYRGVIKSLAMAAARFNEIIYKLIFRKSSIVFFLSSELMKKFGGCNPASYFIFTSLIDEEDIHVRRIKKCVDVRLLYVGALRHEKGIEYLIEAVKMLADDHISVLLNICGDGPEKKRLESLALQLNLKERVFFHGFLPWGVELSRFYLTSDIFVLPSISEGVPKVLLEAMAKGIPIVSTNVGGVPDIISDMENGVLVPPKAPLELANAVMDLINNVELRKKIVKNGYRFIREHTVDKQAERIVEIIYNHTHEFYSSKMQS